MGVVIRQSFISSVFGYLGIVIGYVNVIILMPKYLTLEEIGLYRTVIACTMLLVPFAMLGSSATMQRFFPKFSENTEKLISLTFALLLAGFVLVSGLFLVFKEQFFLYFSENATRVNDYYYLIPILLFFIVIFSLLESFSKANLNIIFPNFLRDVVYKIFTTSLVVLFAIGAVSFDAFLYSQVLFYMLISLTLLIHISRRFSFLSFIKKIKMPTLDRKVIGFSLFSFLSVAGVTIVTYIDQVMVSRYLGLSLNGIYTTAVFITVVIEYPKRFVSQISYQIMVNSYEKHDIEGIGEHYRKASINQGIVGGLIFLLILINLDNIFGIMPKGESFAQGRNVFILVGLAKLSNMFFSLGSEIISISRIYRYNVILAILLGMLTVISNLLLIPLYGIDGAAMATLISFIIYDIIKFTLVKYHLNIQPFNKKTLLAIALIAVCIAVNKIIPQFDSNYVDAITRSFLVTSFFLFLTYFAGLSVEINNHIKMYLAKAVNLLRR